MVNTKSVELTINGKRELEEELDRRKNQDRTRIKEAIKEAREQGDLSENADLVKDFQICGSESDPFLGKISTDSPLAKAVLSHRVGEKFIMTTENGIDVELELLSLK